MTATTLSPIPTALVHEASPRAVTMADWVHSRPTLSLALGSLIIALLVLATPALAVLEVLQSVSRFGRPATQPSLRAVVCPVWRFPGY